MILLGKDWGRMANQPTAGGCYAARSSMDERLFVWCTLPIAATLVCALLLAVCAGQANAQRPGEVGGVVYDAGTREPIAGAQVLLLPHAMRATTDATGRFALQEIPSGTYQLRVVRIGYRETARTIEVLDARRTEVD